jgi:hypothetical protein
MRIDTHEWMADVGALLFAIFVSDRDQYQASADKEGLSLIDYAAACVLQYLQDHHGDELELIDHDVN